MISTLLAGPSFQTLVANIISLNKSTDQLIGPCANINAALKTAPGFADTKVRKRQFDAARAEDLGNAMLDEGFSPADVRRVIRRLLLLSEKRTPEAVDKLARRVTPPGP